MKAPLLALLIVFSSAAVAEDLGVIGETYPIKEKDMIQAIEEKLAGMQESGELQKEHEQLRKRSESYARRPPGTDLPRAYEYRATPVDLSFELSEDISDADGNVLFEKGLRVNPLKYRPLTRALCFIDGDDQLQVDWLAGACPGPLESKVILVDGPVVELSEELQRRLYFDQHGVLVARFRISALPAVVRQSGEMLFVEEFPVE